MRYNSNKSGKNTDNYYGLTSQVFLSFKVGFPKTVIVLTNINQTVHLLETIFSGRLSHIWCLVSPLQMLLESDHRFR